LKQLFNTVLHNVEGIGEIGSALTLVGSDVKAEYGAHAQAGDRLNLLQDLSRQQRIDGSDVARGLDEAQDHDIAAGHHQNDVAGTGLA